MLNVSFHHSILYKKGTPSKRRRVFFRTSMLFTNFMLNDAMKSLTATVASFLSYVLLGLALFSLHALQLAAEEKKSNPLLEQIEKAKSTKAEKINVDQDEISYIIYEQPIFLLLVDTPEIPLKHDVSPLYSVAAQMSTLQGKFDDPKKRFEAYFSFWRTLEPTWKQTKKYYQRIDPDFSKDRFAETIRRHVKEMTCLGEVTFGDLTAVICAPRHMEFRPPAAEDENAAEDGPEYLIYNICYRDDGRYYALDNDFAAKNPDVEKFFNVLKRLLDDGDQGIYSRLNAQLNADAGMLYELCRKKYRQPSPLKYWYLWQQEDKSPIIEAAFLSSDGSEIKLKKRDDDSEMTVKYSRLTEEYRRLADHLEQLREKQH